MNRTWKCIYTMILLSICMFFAAGCESQKSVLITQDTAEMQEPVRNTEAPEKEEQKPAEETKGTIFVDICGAVVSPGVYELPEGSRIYQAVAMAGGFLEDAAVEDVNQAQCLTDGCQIRIYTVEERQQLPEEQRQTEEAGSSGKVDLNRADKAMLMTLQGIGETRAEAILAYRDRNGGFSNTEELMQVEGIKQKTYEKLKDQITVNGS